MLMALIECRECHKEISSKASACPSCGARRGSHPVTKIFLFVVAAFVVILIIAGVGGSGGSSSASYTKSEVCDQSGEAAHYIAAMSASSDDVVRVTDQVVADRKYSVLGDKVVGAIGMMVALSRNDKTPDEISDMVRQKCLQ
jgi:hypothetical protein